MEENNDLFAKMALLEDGMCDNIEKVIDIIITNKVDNKGYIERQLNYLLDIDNHRSLQLFLRLCDYYKDVDFKRAIEYLSLSKNKQKLEQGRKL